MLLKICKNVVFCKWKEGSCNYIMIKVITYGTYDLLHYGHIKLLERAKALGDYLIVGVTADDFDKTRGKINVQQSLMERVEAVRSTGIADEIIIEEYEGQKIDDIQKYDVDIFTVGSDWIGYFDYLNEYCKVVYLPRTEGVSSSEIRAEKRLIRLGLVGNNRYLNKFLSESKFVNGVEMMGICSTDKSMLSNEVLSLSVITENYDDLLKECDAVYIHSSPEEHFLQIKRALEVGKHVMCESPLALSKKECSELLELAKEKKLILMESLRTAYSTAFDRMLLLVKGGKIGEIVSIDATCTSLKENDYTNKWNSISAWGPTSFLPIFDLLGNKYESIRIISKFINREELNDSFTKIDFLYNNAVASVKVGYGVKSEGELVISGTKGYVYVPAPWWKTDYFEIRYEKSENNKRYFYQLDGEGIRNEIVTFVRAISSSNGVFKISEDTSISISVIMEEFFKKENYRVI